MYALARREPGICGHRVGRHTVERPDLNQHNPDLTHDYKPVLYVAILYI